MVEYIAVLHQNSFNHFFSCVLESHDSLSVFTLSAFRYLAQSTLSATHSVTDTYDGRCVKQVSLSAAARFLPRFGCVRETGWSADALGWFIH
ncbi:hypothetical protein BaRGS_00022286 [Batillaria attramentaria]|uniref:Uncharacterized protein n=1 Tax=Batillaria attramentaria TaxID=370345 RepID=A0ABD0KHL8_9CAEN